MRNGNVARTDACPEEPPQAVSQRGRLEAHTAATEPVSLQPPSLGRRSNVLPDERLDRILAQPRRETHRDCAGRRVSLRSTHPTRAAERPSLTGRRETDESCDLTRLDQDEEY